MVAKEHQNTDHQSKWFLAPAPVCSSFRSVPASAGMEKINAPVRNNMLMRKTAMQARSIHHMGVEAEKSKYPLLVDAGTPHEPLVLS